MCARPALPGRSAGGGALPAGEPGRVPLIAYMQRLMQLKYPAFSNLIHWPRAEELLHKHSYVSTHYQADLDRWARLDYYDEHVHKIQLPYNAVSLATVLDRRQQQAKRMQELAQRKRVERLAQDEEKLEQLLKVQAKQIDSEEAYQNSLQDFGLKSDLDLMSNIETLKAAILKAKDKISQASSDNSTHTNTTGSNMADGADAGNADDLDSETQKLIADLHQKRKDLLEKRLQRRKRRIELGKRSSHLSHERRKLLHLLAHDSGRDNDSDTFGEHDDDWEVYRNVAKDGDETDSEEEQNELTEIEQQLQRHDPVFRKQLEQLKNREHLTEEDVAQLNQLHLGVERIRVPELLFQPSMIGHEQGGITETIEFVLKKFSSEHQQRLTNAIFVSGCCPMLPNLIDRLKRDIQIIRPFQSTFNIYATEHVGIDGWIGMANWCKTQMDSGNLASVSISRAEYNENGAGFFKQHSYSNVPASSCIHPDEDKI